MSLKSQTDVVKWTDITGLYGGRVKGCLYSLCVILKFSGQVCLKSRIKKKVRTGLNGLKTV